MNDAPTALLAGVLIALGVLLGRGKTVARQELVRVRAIVQRELGGMPPPVSPRGISEWALIIGPSLCSSVIALLVIRGRWAPVPLPLLLGLVGVYWVCGSTLFDRKMRRGDYAGALRIANRRLRLTPASWLYLHRRGRALLGIGLYDEAAASFQTALAEADDRLEAWATLRDLGGAFTNLGKREEAARSLRAASELGVEIPAAGSGSLA